MGQRTFQDLLRIININEGLGRLERANSSDGSRHLYKSVVLAYNS